MFATYRDQAALKAAAGIDARGRKNTHPVLHFTLAWPKGEQPSEHHMKETALPALKAIGLEEHQALITAHTDKQHAHVHLVVNTVHPTSGRTADQKFSKLAFSRWAEAYELTHGIHCKRRVENNADREAIRITRTFERAVGAGQGFYVPIRDRSPARGSWLARKEHARGANDPVNGVLAALTQHNSTFTRRDLAMLVSIMTNNADSFRTLMARVEGSPELAKLPGTDRLTTKTMLQAESILAATVDAMASDRSHPMSAKGLRLLARRTDLGPEQMAALRHVSGPDAIRGRPCRRG